MPTWADYDFKETGDDNTETEKGWELTSYADYLQETEDKKKEEIKRPKELQGKNKDILKIVKYDTNKHKIKQRKFMEDNIIPQHASAVVFCGRSGSGKSNLLVNLAERPEFYGKTKKDNPKTGYFDLVFMFSPTCHHDDLPKYLDIPPNRMYDRNFEPPLKHIIKTQKDIIEKKGLDKAPKLLIIFDDIISQKKFMNSEFFTQMYIQNRHLGISTWVCTQSFNKIPRVCRLQANNLFIFAGSGSETEILTAEFCPPHTNKKQFENLIKHATNERYNFLHINMRCPPEERYRRNLDTILTINKNE
jgi:hypothetical protein